jgi:hypothetical protein
MDQNEGAPPTGVLVWFRAFRASIVYKTSTKNTAYFADEFGKLPWGRVNPVSPDRESWFFA